MIAAEAPRPVAPLTEGRWTRAFKRARQVPLPVYLLWGWSGLVLLFAFAPAVVVFVTSLSDTQIVAFPPRGLSLRWYSAISPTFARAAVNSVILASIAAVGSCLLGIPAALALVRARIPGRPVLETLLRSPLILPQVVVGVVTFQAYSLVFDVTGIRLTGTMLGLALIHIAITVPFVMTSVAAALVRFPPSLEEAAYGLGAGRMRTFFLVTLPLIKPAVFAGAFFSFLISFENVPVSLFLVSTGTGTLPLEVFNAVQFSLQPDVFAVSTLIIVFSALLTVVWERFVGLRNSGSGLG